MMKPATVDAEEIARRMKHSLSETLESLQRLGVTGNTGADDTLASGLSPVPPPAKLKTK